MFHIKLTEQNGCRTIGPFPEQNTGAPRTSTTTRTSSQTSEFGLSPPTYIEHRNKALYIHLDWERMVRFMRRRQSYYLSILCAVGAGLLLLAACAANEQTYTPPVHKMVGTNSGGY